MAPGYESLQLGPLIHRVLNTDQAENKNRKKHATDQRARTFQQAQ